MTTFYLIRQAEAASSPDIPEELWPLSAKGLSQSHSLIPILGKLGIHFLYASQEKPAIATVQSFAEAYDLDILVLSELSVLKTKLHEGERRKQAWIDFDFSIPSSESNRMAQRRIVQTIHSLMLHHLTDVVAVVMHSHALALFLNAIDPSFTYDQWQQHGLPDILRLVRGEYKITWAPIDHPRPPLALVRRQDSANL